MTATGTVLDDRELRCVLAVARSGSLRGAARLLGLAPSAVQRTIAAVERRLDGVLFERDIAGARITVLGQVVVRHAQERQDLEAGFAEEMARARTAEVGEVSLAVGLGFLEDIGTQVLGPFHAAHPEVTLRVRTGGTDSMVEALTADAADIAIALHPAPSAEVTAVRTLPQPLGLACAADHPLARRCAGGGTLRPEELAGQRFAVMLPGFGLRALHDEFARVHGVEGDVVLETDSQAVLIGAVALGQAVSLLPPVFLTPAPPGAEVVLLDISDEHLLAVRAELMVRRGRRLPAAARALLTTCAEWMDSQATG
ncbi:MAG: LysR family transcriptional regulator [Brachybacterium sp.]|uniref:LysR family transcriptional regulator n=1 Tax=Brachybacterium sp. AOP42-B2-9 TaxID=3457672 RepID=UPI003FB90D88